MSFSIPITHHISDIKINEGIYILLHRASKIPPHIGLIVNGKLFEISTSGPGYNLSGEVVLQTAQKRGVEVVLVELKSPNHKIEDLEQLITKLVKHYDKVTKDVSCLNPIQDFIEQIYKIDLKSVNFIFELLPILYFEKLVKSSYQVNLTHQLIDNNFLLKIYTKNDVEHCITAVNRKNNIEVNLK